MRMNNSGPKWNIPKRGSSPGEPLRTFLEFAEEFGVSQQVLMVAMAHHPDAPKPLTRSSRCNKPQRYYKPSEMRKWWKTIQETKCQPQS